MTTRADARDPNIAEAEAQPPNIREVAEVPGGPRGGGGDDRDQSFFRVQAFVRGDFNVDGAIDIADATAIFGFLFLGGEPSSCLNAGDTNADVGIDVSDGSYLLNWLFLGGPEPPSPGPHECGVDRRDAQLSCESYDPCPDELPLISHVLNRITFGPTQDLQTLIQTRADLIAYIEQQLDPPSYVQAIHEPDLHAIIEAFEIGYNPDGPTANVQPTRFKSMLLVDAIASRWQLLHKVALFWNNHFHTQIGTLRNNVFGRGPVGGGASRSNAQQFAAADTDASGAITEAEWEAFRLDHPGAVPFSNFARVNRNDPANLTQAEYLSLNTVGYWKYGVGNQQFGISADMERREYDAFRRYGFGGFRDLVEMHAKSIAQVVYLNNFENTVLAPNENYGREYLELFVLGDNHMYVQRDIEELSKIFTGWSLGWHLKSLYEDDDILRIRHPEAQIFALNLREPAPFRFAIPTFWSDELYTWGFHFGHPVRGSADGHDWGRKDLFLPQYGGVDSLGNPVPPSAAIRIAENLRSQTVAAAMEEFDLVLDRTTGFRDSAKFICTKLIQLFVTDDLSDLAKTQAMPEDLAQLFDAADLDSSGAIERSEWDEPTPDLPNGKPPSIFERLDVDGNDEISQLEYQEPDLLLDALAAWQSSDGNIGEVLRTILLSDEFLSMKFYRAKVKDPFENITSTIRGTNAIPALNQIAIATEDLRLAGMELIDFADPTGESELGFDWMHTVGLLERLKYVNRVVNPVRAADARAAFDPASYRTTWDLDNAERTIRFFALLILGGDILDNHVELAETAYREAVGTADVRIRAAVAYLLSLPQFQKQ